MSNKKEENVNLLMDNFLGEFVEIMMPSNGETSATLAVKGYLLDMDNEYLYVGGTPNAIGAAVPRNPAPYIQISEPTDQTDDMLDELETPIDKKQYN